MRTHFLRGPRKWLVDLALVLRVALLGIRRVGLIAMIREARAYFASNRNLAAGSADRYVQRGDQVFAASALSPLTSDRIAGYMLDEILTFNRREPAPTAFALLAVSSRCPYRCKHCYALADLSETEAVPVDALQRCVAGLVGRGIPNLFFTGGEPMHRIDALADLMAANAAGVDTFWIVSTGWHMDRAALEPLLPHKLAGVVISLDSRIEEETNRSKGHREAHANAVAAIRCAIELGLLVSVDCMVTSRLLDRGEFRLYMEYLRDLGVHFVNFFPPHKAGGVEKYSVPTLTTDEFAQLESLIGEVNRGRAHRDFPIAYSAIIWERSRGCSGGQQFLYINPQGDVRPCPFLDAPAGNIAHTPIEEILDHMRELAEQGGCYAQYKDLEVGRRT